MKRERLGSRLGFILLSAGCAIGVGNVWKFPYIAGENGGGFFVLFYLFFLIIMGVPVMTMEFSLGRASQKSPVKIYDELAPKGSKWKYHGYAAMAGNYLLMMFYTTVAGWMISYFVSMLRGEYQGLSPEQVGAEFTNLLNNPASMIFYMGIIVVAGFFICSFSLQKGLERVTKYMMLALLAIMVVLAINSVFLPGGAEGLSFYLKPNVNKIKEIGVFNVIVAAMNQAFFTLSLGIGSMAIFGSYIDKERSLLGESVNVALLDTFVAVTSGLIIFPACFAYNVQPDSGPSLIFVTLPNIFNNMQFGRIWGSFFFLFMTFAAFSTVLAVFENIIACYTDLFKCSKKKACLINGVLLFVLSLPCLLGFNVLKNVMPFGEGSNIMDLEDFIVSNLLLPLGSLTFLLFCVNKKGWGWDNFVAEANQGKGLKVKNWMRGYITYVLPVITVIFFVIGIVNFFNK
ncbi:MAG: sodium-dependent transporter [Acutalibacteraceae bacterium]|nr:sodium-dependent transporter [Acutalibacteraceae bacterium]